MSRRRLVIAAIVAIVTGASAAILAVPALADGAKVVADCNSNGRLTHTYAQPDLQTAINTMGADVKEYTNCYDVIRRALVAAATGKGGPSNQNGQDAGSGLPAPLIVAFVLLGLTAAGSAAVALRRAIVRRRDTSGP